MERTRTRTDPTREPVWELAHLFPYQGDWTEDDYLALETNQLIEFSQGYLEFLPMPTLAHQFIVLFLHELLKAHVEGRKLGRSLVAPLRVRIGRYQYREPDVVFLSAERLAKTTGDYPDGADLVMEVVSGSPADRDRDWVRKPRDYAEADIPEYWIIDPDERVIVVLGMEGNDYVEHGRFSAGDIATSALLPGFSVPVDDVWAAAQLPS